MNSRVTQAEACFLACCRGCKSEPRRVFTIIDSNHHVEDWTFMPAGSKPVHAHMDFKRVQ